RWFKSAPGHHFPDISITVIGRIFSNGGHYDLRWKTSWGRCCNNHARISGCDVWHGFTLYQGLGVDADRDTLDVL
ncbi:MAG: hypothetical protein ACPIB6_10895, partial [Henriciella sp.]